MKHVKRLRWIAAAQACVALVSTANAIAAPHWFMISSAVFSAAMCAYCLRLAIKVGQLFKETP